MTKNPEDKKLVTKGMVKEVETWNDEEYPIKVKNTDQDLITKRQAKEALNNSKGYQSFGEFYESGDFEAIDQLPAEPQGKDCVERDEVLNLLHDFDDKILKETLRYLRVVIKDLPSVFPAHQARPDEEIEKAISTFDSFEFTYSLDARHLSENDNLDFENFKREAGGFLGELLRWVLNKKQDTWTDKELLGLERRQKEKKP